MENVIIEFITRLESHREPA